MKSKILVIAPFALTPKGTVQSRIVPMCKILETLNYKIDILIAPFDNSSYSEKIINISENIRIINTKVEVTVDKVILNPKFIYNAFKLVFRLFNFVICNYKNYNIFYIFKPKGLSGLVGFLLIMLNRRFYLDTDDWEGDGGWNDKANYSSIFKKIFKYQELILLKKAELVTVASKALETICLSLGVSRESLFYLPNGYEILSDNSFVSSELILSDKEITKLKSKHGINKNDIVFLYYSRFFEFSTKNTIKYLSALLKNNNVKLLIIGKGFNNEKEDIVKGLDKYSSNIVDLGWQVPDEIRKYFSIIDYAFYFFDDTLINRTKCPAKLVEMLSFGVPVIGSKVGQINEFIDNGKNGFLFDNFAEYLNIVNSITKNNDMYLDKETVKKYSMSKLSMKQYIKLIFRK